MLKITIQLWELLNSKQLACKCIEESRVILGFFMGLVFTVAQ